MMNGAGSGGRLASASVSLWKQSCLRVASASFTSPSSEITYRHPTEEAQQAAKDLQECASDLTPAPVKKRPYSPFKPTSNAEFALARVDDLMAWARKASPSEKLVVALYRFGSFGTNSCYGKVARHFGIGEGTVELFTRRVMMALIRKEQEIIRWPNVIEKAETKRAIRAKFCFPNCVGYVDGTDIVLEFQPSVNGEDYFNRKKRYALAAMLVCDHQKKITYAYSGFTGFAHDSRVFKNSQLGSDQERFFAGDEYILADSAYTCTKRVISPHKKSAANVQNLLAFDYQHSRARVGTQHCIGMLKGIFQSLKGIRIQIKTQRDHTRAVLWFKVCCILHNICVENGDQYDETWVFEPAENPEENAAVLQDADEEGPAKRDMIRHYVMTALNE